MWMGLIALFIANFIGGALSPLFVKLGVKEIPPLIFTALRFSLASLVFLPFYLRQAPKKLLKKDIFVLMTQSIFFAGNVALFSIGIQFTSIIISQIFYAGLPIFVGILTYFMFKEKFTKFKFIGSAVALLGVGFLIQQSILKTSIFSFGTLHGNIIVLTAVIFYATYVALSQKMMKNYSPVTTSFFNFIITAAILILILPLGLIFSPIHFDKITIIGIGSLLGAGTISSALMFFLVQAGIKKTSAFTAALFQYTAPFFAAITAIPILGEKPTLPLIIGGILIIFGVFYATTYPYAKRGIRYMLK